MDPRKFWPDLEISGAFLIEVSFTLDFASRSVEFFKSWSRILKPWFRMKSPRVSNLPFYTPINVGLRVEIS